MRKLWSAALSTSALCAALLLPNFALAEGACAEGPCPELVATGATEGSINSLGEVIWTSLDPVTNQKKLVSSRRGELSFQQYNDLSHSAAAINNMGDTAWIMRAQYGPSSFVGTNISGKETNTMMSAPPMMDDPRSPDINDRQEVVWAISDTSMTTQIYSTVRGRLTTDWTNYDSPSINNKGDVVFLQYGQGPAQVFKLPSGSTTVEPVTSDSVDHISPAINDSGEIVWAAQDASGVSIVSTLRGVLPIAVAGKVSRVDVNNCGDVVYSVNENGVENVYRWGNSAPCVSAGQNTSLAQATPVAFGDLFTGVVDAASPQQWYKFDASAGQKIQVLANGPVNLGLYNGDGNLISGPTGTTLRSIITSAAYSGTYFLKAEAAAGASPVYLSLSNYSQNCGAGPCQEYVASDAGYDSSINSLGEVVWRQKDPVTLKYGPIFSSTRGQLPITITSTNGAPVAVNNHGDVAWLDANSPDTVHAFIAGQEVTLATEDYIPSVDINDLGEVIWSGRRGIYSNLRGLLTDDSMAPGRPSINNHGDIVFVDANTYAMYKIAGGGKTLEMVNPWSFGHYPVITDSGEIISEWYDDNYNTRFTSEQRGDLGYLVPAFINNLDVNSCGDLLYSVQEYPSPTADLYRLGPNAPCMIEPERLFGLSVSKTADSTGNGTVTSSPAVISLGATDKLSVAALPAGSLVTLTATPDANSVFMGWSGACSGTGTCEVTMDLVKSVYASFQPGNDTTPPTVTITSPVAGYTKDAWPHQLLYSVSDGNVVTKLDGVVVNMISGDYFNSFKDGEHVVRVESTDGSGNLGFAEVRFTVDTTAPVIDVVSPAAGISNVNDPVLNYTVSEGTVTIYLDRILINKVSGDVLGTLQEGNHWLQIHCVDKAGNYADKTVAFTVDTLPPYVSITSPASGLTRNNTPSLLYKVYEGAVVVKVDGVVVNKVSGDQLDMLGDGPHAVRVESTDDAGNMGFAETKFTVDSVAPVVTISSPAAGVTPDQTPYLDYTFNEGIIAVKVDGVTVGTRARSSLGVLSNGTHTVTVESTDDAGNVGSASVTFTVNHAPLYVAPVDLGYGITGAYYTQTLTATGSVQPYVWSVIGSLPPGLSINPATGEISGVTTASGLYRFYVKVAADNGAETYQVPESIQVLDPLVITNVNLGSGYAGEPYSGSLSATSGSGSYLWSVVSGTLPPGLTLNPSTGVVSGTPSASGTFNFSVQVTDYHSADIENVTVVINPARPDLVVSSVNGPTSSGGGRKATIYVTVTNRGAGTAPASNIGVYLSNDSLITSGDTLLTFASVASIPSGSSQTLAVNTTLPKTIPAGNYYFGAIADEPASLEESNEANNALAGNIVTVK